MIALCYWFSFYDNIYEHPDRPSQKIIENDDLLDKWVEDKSKEMEDRARKNSGKYKNAPMGALNHDEVIIFDDADDDYQDELEEDEDDYEEY